MAFLGGGALVTILVLIFLGAAGGTLTPGPTQPIPFDHSIHAGTNAIACEFCHSGVDKQAAATIPSVEQCMFCHNVVGKALPNVQALADRWESQQAIDWVRVHRLPDTVGFVHEPHIRAGIDCATCHGDVTTFAVMRQVRSLNMGDCMACHRQNGAPLECATCHK